VRIWAWNRAGSGFIRRPVVTVAASFAYAVCRGCGPRSDPLFDARADIKRLVGRPLPRARATPQGCGRVDQIFSWFLRWIVDSQTVAACLRSSSSMTGEGLRERVGLEGGTRPQLRKVSSPLQSAARCRGSTLAPSSQCASIAARRLGSMVIVTLPCGVGPDQGCLIANRGRRHLHYAQNRHRAVQWWSVSKSHRTFARARHGHRSLGAVLD